MIQPDTVYYPARGYAGFWKRFVANLIDKLLLGAASLVVLIPVFMMLGLGAGLASATDELEGIDEEMTAALIVLPILLAIVITSVASWLYYALMESSSHQATLGKMALGVQVTDANGHRISFGRATGRYFGKIISSLTMMIGYIIAGFTQQKQALHDILASTLVVNK
jgi:uncharacterized RDD family membrane protein YckC